jgi:hypothetical protein
VRWALFFVVILVALNTRAACRCPASAISGHLLVTTPHHGRGGVVACGYEDSRRGKVVRASEFQVFRCDRPEALFALSAAHSAMLEPVGGALRVVEIAHWPFGAHWKWIEVPIAEWFIDSDFSARRVPRPRLPKPLATKGEVQDFLRHYRTWLASPKRDHANAEDLVGRLFAAATTGDAEAGRLWLSMRSDAGLDGAASEDYATAEYDLKIGSKSQTK